MLTNIPSELLQLVANNLNLRNINNLKITCKDFYNTIKITKLSLYLNGKIKQTQFEKNKYIEDLILYNFISATHNNIIINKAINNLKYIKLINMIKFEQIIDLNNFPNLETLYVNNGNVILGKSNSLKSIIFNDINPDNICGIEWLNYIPNVKKFELKLFDYMDYNSYQLYNNIEYIIRNMTNLEIIKIPYDLNDISKFPKLKILKCNNWNYSNNNHINILKNIESLHLIENKKTGNIKDIDLSLFKNLTELNISGNFIVNSNNNDNNIDIKYSSIKKLELHNNNNNNNNINLNNFMNLEELILHPGCNIHDKDISNLNLKKLSIENVNITKITHLINLTYLKIVHSKISNDDLNSLINLKTLIIDTCVNIKDISNLINLEYLHIKGINKIKKLPQNIIILNLQIERGLCSIENCHVLTKLKTLILNNQYIDNNKILTGINPEKIIIYKFPSNMKFDNMNKLQTIKIIDNCVIMYNKFSKYNSKCFKKSNTILYDYLKLDNFQYCYNTFNLGSYNNAINFDVYKKN